MIGHLRGAVGPVALGLSAAVGIFALLPLSTPWSLWAPRRDEFVIWFSILQPVVFAVLYLVFCRRPVPRGSWLRGALIGYLAGVLSYLGAVGMAPSQAPYLHRVLTSFDGVVVALYVPLANLSWAIGLLAALLMARMSNVSVTTPAPIA